LFENPVVDDDAIEMAHHLSLVLGRSCDRVGLSAKCTHAATLLVSGLWTRL
jgi:hypothetical protein